MAGDHVHCLGQGVASATYGRRIFGISLLPKSSLAISVVAALAACGGSAGGPAFSARASGTPSATPAAQPPSLSSVEAKLVSTADVPGSVAFDLKQRYGNTSPAPIQPCFHPGSGLGAASALVFGEAAVDPTSGTATGGEYVTEIVLLANASSAAPQDAQLASSYLQSTETAINACPPHDTQAFPLRFGNGTMAVDDVTSNVAIGGWSGVKTVAVTTNTPPLQSLAGYVDYEYFVARQGGFLVAELDVGFNNVGDTAQNQQAADQLATVLLERLPA